MDGCETAEEEKDEEEVGGTILSEQTAS